jgi:hypothetical protein
MDGTLDALSSGPAVGPQVKHATVSDNINCEGLLGILVWQPHSTRSGFCGEETRQSVSLATYTLLLALRYVG